jgi:hypothetical protein
MARGCDLVFLVPGFLGFDRFRDFAYFGDRFASALRAALMPRIGRPVQVVPVSMPPTGALSVRQYALGRSLVERARALSDADGCGVESIHLVGHSTGGVDAQLLTMPVALAGRDFHDFGGIDVGWLRERLRSVISLAAPHQGTCLAADPLAHALASDSAAALFLRAPAALQEVGTVAGQIWVGLRELAFDPDTRALLSNVIGSPAAGQFFCELAQSRALIDDLTPARSVRRYASLGEGLPVLRRSFVTVAGVTPSADRNAVQAARDMTQAPAPAPPTQRFEPKIAAPDPIFLLLAQLTSGRLTDCFSKAGLMPGSLEALQAAHDDGSRLIARSASLLPPILDPAVNDGVVNSVRQLIDPSDPNELAGLVVADHFDVIGHYDRALFVTDPKTGALTEKELVAGLLHSGSQFRDDQFFSLIDRIAEAMRPAF